MRRIGLVLAMFFAVVTASAAFGNDSTGSSVESTAPTTVAAAPTFIRITVTPVPIDTPTPTAVPTSGPQFMETELADPVFPDWLDPELNDERPEDDVVYEGWREYLTNTHLKFTWGREKHFCADGVVLDAVGQVDQQVEWLIERTAAMSTLEWGKVALIVHVISGESEGRKWTATVISVEGGKIVMADSTELQATRSQKCLELGS